MLHLWLCSNNCRTLVSNFSANFTKRLSQGLDSHKFLTVPITSTDCEESAAVADMLFRAASFALFFEYEADEWENSHLDKDSNVKAESSEPRAKRASIALVWLQQNYDIKTSYTHTSFRTNAEKACHNAKTCSLHFAQRHRDNGTVHTQLQRRSWNMQGRKAEANLHWQCEVCDRWPYKCK